MENIEYKLNILYDKEYIEIQYGDFKLNNKIALFDLDKTLIINKSEQKYFVDRNDWLFFHTHIPFELRELNYNNYSIFIITNQKGLHNYKNEWLQRLNIILNNINVPIKVFVATHYNIFRKPYPGFFDLIKKSYDEKNMKFNINKSFFVGDACGRTNDHSDCDLKFALNCNLKFKTPEAFLSHCDYSYDKTHFIKKINLNYVNPIINPINKSEVIIVIGLPGSGKSHYINKLRNDNFKNYIVTNFNFEIDTNKTKEFIINHIENNSIFIDNNNLKNDIRNKLAEFLSENNIPFRYIIMDTPKEICMHNLYYKYYKTSNKQYLNEDILNSLQKIKIKINNIENCNNSIFNIKFTLFDYYDDYFLFI